MDRIKKFLSSLTGKKHHVEFITALLSIPVLLTVILLNLNNLNAKKTEDNSNTKPNQIIISMAAQPKDTPIPTKEACKAGLGQVIIANPHEGDIVSDNPLNFTISYDPGEYCAAVWSYRINGGNWSDFDDKSIALYDLPSGIIKFDLRVKSVVSGGGETTISRNITYVSANPSPSPTPTSIPTPTQSIPTTSPAVSQ